APTATARTQTAGSRRRFRPPARSAAATAASPQARHSFQARVFRQTLRSALARRDELLARTGPVNRYTASQRGTDRYGAHETPVIVHSRRLAERRAWTRFPAAAGLSCLGQRESWERRRRP